MRGKILMASFYDFVSGMYVKNKSFTYIMPMLGSSYQDFSNVKGCFIRHEDYPELETSVFVIVKLPEIDFQDYIKKAEKHKQFKHCDLIGGEHALLFFDVPKEYLNDYTYFVNGKYSKLSENYKRKIIGFWDARNISNVIDVLYKNEKAFKRLEAQYDIEIPRDIEASSVLDMDKETYKKDTIINENKVTDGSEG